MSNEGLAQDSLSVEVRRGAPTAEELAALMAVVTQAYEEESTASVRSDEPERSAWVRSARDLRRPLDRSAGWGRFEG